MPEDHTAQELQRQLAERDAVIGALMERVDDLVQRLEELEERLDRPPPDQAIRSEIPLPSPPRPASPAAVTSGDRTRAETETSQPAAPGQLEIDEEEIDRALERTLVQQGVLLLPIGMAEIQPSFGYTRREIEVPAFFDEDGTRFVAMNRVRRDEFRTGLVLRIGSPYDSQFTIGAPFRHIEQSTVTTVGVTPRQEVKRTGSGFGDISIDFAKTLMRERGWWPDVVASLSWDTNTGKNVDNGVALGGGFHDVGGSLRAVKRQDPLAFVGSVSYLSTLESDGVDPGDELGVSLGTVLAASPETSLRFFFDLNFIAGTELDGQAIRGSDEVTGAFTVGGSSIIVPGIFLDIAGTAGLTERGLDFALRTSVPIRFNLPIR